MKALYLLLTGCFLLNGLCSFCQTNTAKISPDLAVFLKAKKAEEMIKVLLTTTDTTLLKKWKEVKIIHRYDNTFLVEAKASDISKLMADTTIRFISLWRQPKEELTTGAFDLTLNKINLLHNTYPSINGNDVNVSVKEQRFDTTDIDFKGRILNAGVAASTQSVHASIMATIIGGGGNSSPFAKGAAPGSNLSSSDFTTLLPDATQVYTSKNIYLQNHSYGTAIENFYGADAAAYDASVYTIPTLVHVFSAGNSGTSSSTSGLYSGVANYANLTGSFKMAKNSITVGHVDSAYNILALSSKGPAYDGRIKPELVAFGEDGSSGAAALVSGTAALLQQAYKTTHNNSYPSVALVKAVLLNSADDIGEKGIDYKSGFGNLNAFNAIQTITGNSFIEDVISKSAIKNISLTVPLNTKQLKVTIAWTDTAAAPNASKALINDLDAVLKFNSQSWLPWVLNNKPNKDSLVLPAIRSVDTLNNMEQLTIDNPQQGIYTLQISGSKMVTASQAFAVAYQTDTANTFTWTYPSTSDIIKAAKRNYLRWQSNLTGNGILEYSTDKAIWQTITNSADLAKGYFIWTTPDTTTLAYLRMRPSASSLTFQTDTFVISQPLEVTPGFNCSDSFLLYWNRLRNSQYQLYQLGLQYLQPFQSTADTAKVLAKSTASSLYYAVAPKLSNKIGQRSFTINYTTQGVGCYVVSFYSVLQNDDRTLLTLNLGTLYNVAEIAFQKEIAGVFQTIQRSSSIATLSSFTDAALSQGLNRYRAQIKLIDGSFIYSDVDQVTYFPAQPVVVFPNPVQHNNAINIVVKDQSVYSIQIYDIAGRLIKTLALNNLLTNIPSFTLSKGIYFLQITGELKKRFTQKLVVY